MNINSTLGRHDDYMLSICDDNDAEAFRLDVKTRLHQSDGCCILCEIDVLLCGMCCKGLLGSVG